VGRIAANAAGAGVALCQGIEGLLGCRVLIEAFIKDGFDSAIARAVVVQSPLAGGLEASSSVPFLEPDDALGRTQILQYPDGEQAPDQASAGIAGLAGLDEAP
jgi:hypothetical protein